MAIPDRLEIMYATFRSDVRLDSQSDLSRVVVRSETRKIYCGTIQGVLHLIVEDPALRHAGCVPWTNVGCVGWVEDPAIDFVSAPTKPKPPAKTKGAESAA